MEQAETQAAKLENRTKDDVTTAYLVAEIPTSVINHILEPTTKNAIHHRILRIQSHVNANFVEARTHIEEI